MSANKRIHFSFQLFLYVAPLIILPICLVAFLAYTISASGMTHASRDKLLGEAKSNAASIDMAFSTCAKDLEMLWMFFFAEAFDVSEPTKVGNNLLKLVPALHSFKNSFPMYVQVGFWNYSGELVVSSDFGTEIGDFLSPQERRLIMYIAQGEDAKRQTGIYPISPVLFSDRHRNYIVTMGKAVYNPDGEVLGCLMIDLDFSQMVDLISAADPEAHSAGFAFLVDSEGRILYHPNFTPYSDLFLNNAELAINDIINATAQGSSGFEIYTTKSNASQQMAAYAPIKTAGWTLVKTMPLSLFTQSAVNLRNYIFQIGLAAIIAAVFVLWYLAYRVNRPIARLVKATRELAAGNLDVDLLPYTSGTYETMELTNDFNIMSKNLRRIQAELVVAEKMAALGRLSAGLAHELRNPLNAIELTIVYMQRRRNDAAAFNEAAETLYNEIGRLNKFVNDFLRYAKKTPPVKTMVDLGSLVKKIVILNQEQADSLDIKVTLSIADNLPLIAIDSSQIMQVFFNLYNNALQAMPGGGNLDISVSKGVNKAGKRYISVVLQDSGVGIDEALFNNIFEPFFTTKDAGTGLGLAISMSIIEAHGGALSISNVETGGVKVEVILKVDE